MPFTRVLNTLCHSMRKHGKENQKQTEQITTGGLEGVPTTRANFIFSLRLIRKQQCKSGRQSRHRSPWLKGRTWHVSACSTQSGWPPVNRQMVPRFRFSVWQVPWSWFNQLVNERRLPETWQGPHSRFPDYTTLMIQSWMGQFFECCVNDPTEKKRPNNKKKRNTHVRFTGAQTWEEPSLIPLDGDLIHRREMPRWKMIEIRSESSRLFDGQALPRPSYTLARRKYVSGNDTSVPSYT